MKTIFMAVALALNQVPEPKVTVTPNVSVEACRLLKLTAETNGKQLKWIAPASVDLIVSESGRWAVFQSLKPGVYQVAVYTALADIPSDPAIITVTVTNGPIPNPNPPEPTPPTPNPEPNPPAPDDITKDVLYMKLAPIYAADADPNKKDQKAKLITVYKQAIDLINKYQYSTASDYIAQVHIVAAQYLAPTALKALRSAIGEELNKVLPTDPNAKFDKATEDICVRQFTRVIKLLESLK